MMLSRLAGVVLACLATYVLDANAVTIDFQTNNDANIHNNITDPLGGAITQLAPFTSGNYSIYSYIGFDITAFQSIGDPASAVSLELFGYNSTSSLGLDIYGLNDSVSPNWSEDTIDWSNAPGKLTNSIDLASTTLLFSDLISYTGNNVISFSNSTFVDFINNDTDGLITFILTQANVSTSNHAFSSKESSGNPQIGNPGDYAPTLSITTVPVPAAVWLFGSGLLGLIGVARRRKF
ncbi:MAG: DNRLRE domain-containing protein [Gammaproteobacteria bacterium]